MLNLSYFGSFCWVPEKKIDHGLTVFLAWFLFLSNG